MHFANHETLLITVASLSFATLLFMFIYLVYADEDSYEKKDGTGGDDELISRPLLLARAIGHDNISHLRAFRAASFLMVTLPTAWRMHRKREQQMEAAKAKIVEE